MSHIIFFCLNGLADMVCTINESNRQRDVYFILGVEERAFDKWEAFIFITVENSIKTNMLSAEIYQRVYI